MTSSDPTNSLIMPPGLLSQIADYIYLQSYLPNQAIANFAAIAFLSGISVRAYNTYTDAGLNQYMLLLAPTGIGKDEVAKGTSRLFSAVQRSVPAALDFKGPGELVSSAGLIKWLERKPCVISLVGEFGLLMQQMAAQNANANLKYLQRTLLQLYSKSGKGDTFDSIAYSDKDKNTAVLDCPSFRLIGESVPGVFYQSLDEDMIHSGLLPRFMIVEYEGERPFSNADRQSEPCPQLVQSLADFAGHCLNLMHMKQAVRVPAEGDAVALFDDFSDGECREQMEGAGEVVRHLWNRAHLKALKLATLSAISRNPYNPSVCRDDALWAVSMIRSQTERLVGKFSRDEVGVVDGDESKQLAELLRRLAGTIPRLSPN